MIFRISRNAVKEGFDTLPAAICYFDRNGLLRLINHRMQEIAAVLCGCDLQTLTDLEQALHSPGGGVQLRDEAARIYEFPDGTVYHFTAIPCLPHGAHCGMSMTLPGSGARPRSGKAPSPCCAVPGRRMLPRTR